MVETVASYFPGIEKQWSKYKRWFSEITVSGKTTLLKEGEVAKKIFFVKQGCLRLSLYRKGKDITFQFFFENEFVASIDSLRSNQPSSVSIQSIEPSTLIVLQKEGFIALVKDFPQFKDVMLEIAFRRFSHYSKLFISYITNSPHQRYLDLLKNDPRIIQRVPQRYIASYLGITPVSLSRIRSKTRTALINKG